MNFKYRQRLEAGTLFIRKGYDNQVCSNSERWFLSALLLSATSPFLSVVLQVSVANFDITIPLFASHENSKDANPSLRVTIPHSTMPTYQVQSHRVLAIPELLDMVFAFLDDIDNAFNAQVCKLWATVALDVIWKEPCNLHRLFSRLVPLVMVNHEYLFDHLPTATEWKQFDRYALRVRKLVYSPQDPDCEQVYQGRDAIPLSRRLFDDIARTRTRMDVFPNLHTLLWMSPIYKTYPRTRQSRPVPVVIMPEPERVGPWDATVFMHPRVKTFAFHLPTFLEHTYPPPTLSFPYPNSHRLTETQFVSARGHFLSDIASRMPALRTLDLRTSLRASSPSHPDSDSEFSSSFDPETQPPTLQDDLGALLLSLSALHKLILPRFFFTTRIAEAASRLPNLGVVEFQYLPSQGCGWTGDVFPPTGGFAPDLSSFNTNSGASSSAKTPTSSPAKSKPMSALRLFTGTASTSSASAPSSATREDGPFPALYDLSLTSTFADLATFVDSPHYNPSRLTSIYVDSACVVETSSDIARLAEALKENCGMLKYIALVSMRDPASVRSCEEVQIDLETRYAEGESIAEDDEENDSMNRRITLPTILPLLALPLLTSLELTHAWPLGLSLSDIATVASSLPGLETLLLNTEPVHLYIPTFTLEHRSRRCREGAINVPGLEVLSVVARRCRLLRHFGVFLDATGVGNLWSTAARRLRQVGGGDGSVPPSPVKRALKALPFSMDSESEEEERADKGAMAARDGAEDALPSPPPVLSLSFSAASPTFSPTLARLSLGVSAISDGDADAAALYLSHVLPLGCVIDFGVTWEEGLVVRGRGEASTEDEDMDEDVDDDADADQHVNDMADAHPAIAGGVGPGHGPDSNAQPQQPISAPLRAHRTHALHLAVQARCAIWERVAAQVPLLARLRQEERARTRAMERELEALRAREDRRAREQEGVVTHVNSSSSAGGDGQGQGVRMNLAAAATRKTSWANLKELGREWLHL
ncbi:hypothetical protein D9619_003857 [Psilocybe cf. subviscida]|uniref:F-box domain-containing protein n=1 Tax=Psilocybe cf. subviscida TaxID=2480587 RepID=A0A8H5AXM8_9AGAR|nr:hypothetical protein D9619_003857 [Psilocybe cf. subviscida]